MVFLLCRLWLWRSLLLLFCALQLSVYSRGCCSLGWLCYSLYCLKLLEESEKIIFEKCLTFRPVYDTMGTMKGDIKMIYLTSHNIETANGVSRRYFVRCDNISAEYKTFAEAWDMVKTLWGK